MQSASQKLRGGNVKGAIGDYKKALKLSAGNTKARYGLGKAYYAVGPARIPTASFFILERHRPGLRDVAFR